MASQAPQAFLVPPVWTDVQVQMEHQVRTDHKASQVFKAHRVKWDLQEWTVLTAHVETWDPMELTAPRV